MHELTLYALVCSPGMHFAPDRILDCANVGRVVEVNLDPSERKVAGDHAITVAVFRTHSAALHVATILAKTEAERCPQHDPTHRRYAIIRLYQAGVEYIRP